MFYALVFGQVIRYTNALITYTIKEFLKKNSAQDRQFGIMFSPFSVINQF